MSKATRRYQVIFISERCKGCGYCIEFCPKKMLSQSDVINNKGYHLVDVDSNIECPGCNICSVICPDFAINLIPEGDNLKEKVV